MYASDDTLALHLALDALPVADRDTVRILPLPSPIGGSRAGVVPPRGTCPASGQPHSVLDVRTVDALEDEGECTSCGRTMCRTFDPGDADTPWRNGVWRPAPVRVNARIR